MVSQSNGRNQRSKGVKVKQAFKVTLLLVVGIWLLYQIKHSHEKRKEYSESVHNKLGKDSGSAVLGRKGDAGSGSGVEIDSNNGNSMEERDQKEDGGNGDDELDRNAEEKAGSESLSTEGEDSQVNTTDHEEKEDEEPHSNEDNSASDTQIRDRDETEDSDKAKGEESINKGDEDSQERVTTQLKKDDENESETQYNGPQNNDDHTDTQVRPKDEALGSDNDNIEDKDSQEIAKEIPYHTNEPVSTTVPSQNEMGNGVDGFHDENGVPQDGHDLENFAPNETNNNDQVQNVDQEIISSQDNQTGISENIIPAVEEVSNSSQANEQNHTVSSTGDNNSVIETASNNTRTFKE